MNKRAREEDTFISRIYTEELRGLHNKGYAFVAEMAYQLTIKSILYHQRNKSRGNQSEPKRGHEVVLNEGNIADERWY